MQRGKQLFNTAIGPEGRAGQLRASRRADVGHRLGHLLQLSSARADRHRDLDVRGRSAPGDLDGEHLRVRRRPSIVERRAGAARVASARAELVGGPRRGAGLRAEHPRGVRRRRSDPAGIPEGAAGLAQVPDLRPAANTGRKRRPRRHRDLSGSGRARADLSRAAATPLRARSAASSSRAPGCQNCHGGPNWTISTLDFTPPPAGRPRSSTRSSSGSSAASAPSIPACSPTA